MELHCEGCGRVYRLGVDSAVVTSEAITADFRFVVILGKGDPGSKEDPDLVDAAPSGWKPSAALLSDIRRVEAALRRGAERFWKCRACGRVSQYV